MKTLSVLILQVTTSGTVEGLVNVSILPEGTSGIGSNIIQEHFHSAVLEHMVPSMVGIHADVQMKLRAIFDPNAEYDDGSCLAFDECGILRRILGMLMEPVTAMEIKLTPWAYVEARALQTSMGMGVR